MSESVKRVCIKKFPLHLCDTLGKNLRVSLCEGETDGLIDWSMRLGPLTPYIIITVFYPMIKGLVLSNPSSVVIRNLLSDKRQSVRQLGQSSQVQFLTLPG